MIIITNQYSVTKAWFKARFFDGWVWFRDISTIVYIYYNIWLREQSFMQPWERHTQHENRDY